jgi:hypothetical protein
MLCHTITTRTATRARVGSASQSCCQLSRPTAASVWLSGPLNAKMNFHMYDTAIGAMTTGMNSSVRSTNLDFRVRLRASAKSRPNRLVKIRKPNASTRVLISDPVSSSVWKIRLKLSSPTKLNDPMPVQSVNA